jgi:hypothetical protein
MVFVQARRMVFVFPGRRMESAVRGFHLRECATGSFHPAIANGNLLVGITKQSFVRWDKGMQDLKCPI